MGAKSRYIETLEAENDVLRAELASCFNLAHVQAMAEQAAEPTISRAEFEALEQRIGKLEETSRRFHFTNGS